MLHMQIRDKVLRHNIKSFADLLIHAREAEHALAEKGTISTTVNSDGPVRCSYCRKKGHTIDKCFKKNKEVEPKQSVVVAEKAKPKLACYGCNAPGYVRANCPNCSGKPASATNFVKFNSLALTKVIGSDSPTVNIQLFGVPGQAIIDTGARTSVASHNLKRIMDMQGCIYNKVKCEISLADGSKSLQECLSTVCKIVIGGRCLNIQFMILPNATSNRTLLGADFLEEAGIVLNMGQKYWYFESSPDDRFGFSEAWPLKLNLIESIKVARKADEKLENKPKQRCSKVYMSEFENYGPEADNSHYSPHMIQDIFRDCLPPDMGTPERDPNNNLFTGVVYVGSDNEVVPVSLDMVEFKFLKKSDAELLTEQDKEALDMLLSKHEKVFGNIDVPTPYAEHFINTGNHAPISSPPYRLSYPKTRELKEEIDKLLNMGIIEECESAWTSPIVMVPKKDGGVRLCVNYRKINAVTWPNKYPLPRMDDLLHAAKGVTSKFVPKRDGPYIITKRVGSTTYEVAARDNLNIPLGNYHTSALTVYRPNEHDAVAGPLHPLKKRGRPKKQ